MSFGGLAQIYSGYWMYELSTNVDIPSWWLPVGIGTFMLYTSVVYLYSKRIITSIYYNPSTNLVTLGNYNLLAQEVYQTIPKSYIDTSKVPYINEYDKADYLFQIKGNKGTLLYINLWDILSHLII